MSRVLVVGNGAREHALAWKLSQCKRVDVVLTAPGNPGTAGVGENAAVDPRDSGGILRLVRSAHVDLTIIGPESSLAAGVQDMLRSDGHLVIGPSAAAFRLESSKSFAKKVMDEAGVPTARWRSFTDASAAADFVRELGTPVVIKADGLAGGKGVRVCQTEVEAVQSLEDLIVGEKYGSQGQTVVVEEVLRGNEVSLMCLVAGGMVAPFPVAQDHKRLLDGDGGPNTGGMGAVAPVPFLTRDDVDSLVRVTVEPAVSALEAMGSPYQGVLFAGLMLTDAGPRVLEYNCRFGDPETQAVLPLLKDDLYDLLETVALGSPPPPIETQNLSSVAIVLASRGYPDAPELGMEIKGAADGDPESLVFQAGTTLDDGGRLVSAGGRVLTVVEVGSSLAEAAGKAYRSPVSFEGMHRRTDIGFRCGALVPLDMAKGLSPADSSPSRGHDPSKSLDPTMRIVVLASGRGSNLQALIDAASAGALRAQIVGVVSHDVASGSLERARRARVPYAYVAIKSRSRPESRRQHEEALIKTIHDFDPDLLILAGWMLVLSKDAIDAINRPLINVHPALLPVDEAPLDIPVLRGVRAVRDAIDLQLPYTGVSIHHVVPEVDSGQVILREAVSILPDDDEDSLHQRLKLVEQRLLVDAINEMADERRQIVAHLALQMISRRRPLFRR